MALGTLLRRIFSGAASERRSGMLSPEAAWYGGLPYYGATSPYLAENLSAVTSAITLISRTISALPWLVYRQTPQGRIQTDDDAISRLLQHPDGEAGIWSLCDFGEWWISSMLLAGNAVCAIRDDGRGVPVALLPIPWQLSNPQILAGGEVVFNVASAGSLPWWPSGMSPMRISASDVLWLRDRVDVSNPTFGRSALSRAPQVLATASNAASFAASTFATGAKLSGVLRHPGRMSKEAADNLATSWKSVHAGPFSSARVAILEEGMEFSALSMTLEDAELLMSRKFETEEIARFFNIPLPILNVWDHSTFTNSDTASQWFGQLTLAPICKKIEAEFSRVLFNDPSYHLEIDLSALMRGSFSSRIQSEINMVRAGVLTPNEMRLAEGWPALPGGDKLVMQATGGRPAGTEDGAGDALPAMNGSGTGANGAVH